MTRADRRAVTSYLFVVPPLVGHVTPAAGVAAELEARGDDVAWVAHEEVVGHLLGDRPRLFPAGDRFLEEVAHHLPERDSLKGPASLRFLWQRVLLPLAADMADPVRAAIDQFGPDVVVADQQALAGSIVAAQRGLPWVVSASTTAGLPGALAAPDGTPPPRAAGEAAMLSLTKIDDWMAEQAHEACRGAGAAELVGTGFDPRFSPHLVLAFSTPALAGPVAGPWPVELVGPVVPPSLPGAGEPASPTGFPWDWLERHDRHVLVSLGTVSAGVGDRFLRRAVEAVADRDYGAIVVGPDELIDSLPGELPDNVLLRSTVPQLQLLPHLDAVLCHGGHNTVTESLALGRPLVCAPIRDDQPIIAGQVVRSGAGVRLSFGRARPAQIAGAIDEVLHDHRYRDAARRVAASFQAAGGAVAAADHLQRLVEALRQGRSATMSR